MTETTEKKLAEMSGKELLALYNRLANRKAKKFSSRAWGEKTVKELLTMREGAAPLAAPRTVQKLTGDVKKGRPSMEFNLSPATGKTKVRVGSLRGQIMAHIGTSQATMASLEEKFGRAARGAVQKLLEAEWLKRSDKP